MSKQPISKRTGTIICLGTGLMKRRTESNESCAKFPFWQKLIDLFGSKMNTHCAYFC